MKEVLEKIVNDALSAIESSDSSKNLNDVRVRFLGKSGEMTAVLKNLSNVPASVQ